MNKISIKNFNLYYNDFHALKNINLNILNNEITSFIGPSGCGKSTLIKSINRMNDLVDGCKIKGEILVDDRNIYKNTNVTELRRKIGMVFQKPNLFPMSIYSNITYGPKIFDKLTKEQQDEIVEKSLKKVAIWDEVKDRLKKPALELSGGQQQRVCIARALAVEPNIILMDEPTSALDPISTMKIEDLVVELKEKYTIVIVTHNMQQASRISDTTAFFLNGELVECNKTTKIFANPDNIKTEDYITGRFG